MSQSAAQLYDVTHPPHVYAPQPGDNQSTDVRMLDAATAIGHMHWSMTGVDKVPGWNVPDLRNGVITYVFVEREGSWRITALQNTEVVPFKMPE